MKQPADLDQIVGDSRPIRELRLLITRVASTRLPVFIEGPTGAGKELVAQALHSLSSRRGAFVAFNICASPESLFEDALFGHVRGAFTSAIGESAGYLAQADGGTLFLDEIGGLPLTMQAKLLRTLETGEFRPVGASKDRRSDFRVVAAMNESIDDVVAAGRFRADLAHRLAGVIIRVPSLRERRDDIPLLARHFARRIAPKLTTPRLTRGALVTLQSYDWPGNVRELRQVIERAGALSRGVTIDEGDVSLAMGKGLGGAAGRTSPATRVLLDELDACAWNTAHAAVRLGVHRSTVYRRMLRLGISSQLRTRV